MFNTVGFTNFNVNNEIFDDIVKWLSLRSVLQYIKEDSNARKGIDSANYLVTSYYEIKMVL